MKLHALFKFSTGDDTLNFEGSNTVMTASFNSPTNIQLYLYGSLTSMIMSDYCCCCCCERGNYIHITELHLWKQQGSTDTMVHSVLTD